MKRRQQKKCIAHGIDVAADVLFRVSHHKRQTASRRRGKVLNFLLTSQRKFVDSIWYGKCWIQRENPCLKWNRRSLYGAFQSRSFARTPREGVVLHTFNCMVKRNLFLLPLLWLMGTERCIILHQLTASEATASNCSRY